MGGSLVVDGELRTVDQRPKDVGQRLAMVVARSTPVEVGDTSIQFRRRRLTRQHDEEQCLDPASVGCLLPGQVS